MVVGAAAAVAEIADGFATDVLYTTAAAAFLLFFVVVLVVAFFESFPLLVVFDDENGAFWNTIAKPPGDGCSSAPCTARQRRNIVRPMINFKIATGYIASD